MLKLKSATVTNLFGYEGNNYTVDFFPNELITFVYALNGTGKTTLFRLIYAALRQQLTLLDSISFKTLTIVFDNDESIVVEKIMEKHFDDIVLAELPKDDSNRYYFPFVYTLVNSKGETVAEGKYYFDENTSKSITEILSANYEENSRLHFLGSEQVKISDFYKYDLIEESESPELRLIENYLGKFKEINILYANKDYDRLITDQISRRKKDNGNQIRSIFDNYDSLDTVSFEMKYIKGEYDKRSDEIQTMADVIENEWPLGPRNAEQYDKETKYVVLQIPDKINCLVKVLKEIVSDKGFDEYMCSYPENFMEHCEKDLQMFEEIINHKPGLTDKDISINRETGELEIKLFGRDDLLLPPEKLSSGEKNWLLLNFHLIFKAKQGILFIDEPEVSMHPEWLINFTDNLKTICEGRDNQIIIATHSPSITYYDFDLMTELKKKVDNDKFDE